MAFMAVGKIKVVRPRGLESVRSAVSVSVDDLVCAYYTDGCRLAAGQLLQECMKIEVKNSPEKPKRIFSIRRGEQ